jgi:dienelactone hydrolase
MKMITTKQVLIFCLSLLSSMFTYAQQVGHTTITFTDATRSNRQIATEIYYPATIAGNDTPILPGSFPLIVFGHGFVMVYSAYDNIWNALVPEGYIVALPTTEGSFAPVHNDFGLDLKFLVTQIQTAGAGASVPSASVGLTSAIMGHSMGGGSSFLAAAGNTNITTMVTFAAANTNPSSVTAATQVSVPTLIFTGANDCVAPAAQHQDLMYDALTAAYKTQVYVTGGGHCYFANNNLNCTFGESTCTPAPSISRAAQQDATNDIMKLWLKYYLKGDCTSSVEFQDSLSTSNRITYRQNQSIACITSLSEGTSNSQIKLFPNPTNENLQITALSEPISNVAIYDAKGILVYHAIYNHTQSLALDLSTYKKGLYCAVINNSISKNFVVN